MSKEGSNIPKHVKVNRMSVEQAKAAMVKCEAAGDKGSDYYMLCKKAAGSNR